MINKAMKIAAAATEGVYRYSLKSMCWLESLMMDSGLGHGVKRVFQ